MKNLNTLRKRIAAIVFDFDGVLTDNSVYVGVDGQEWVRCTRTDGLAFDAFRKHSIPTFILSTETHPVVRSRAEKLKVPYISGCTDKRAGIHELAKRHQIDLKRTLYVGNDLNDLPAMGETGWIASPSDAHPKIRKMSHFKLKTAGGQGVAREIAEKLLAVEIYTPYMLV